MDRKQAVVELLEREGPRLHRLLARMTLRRDAAEDLLQDLCARLLASARFEQAADRAAFAVRSAVNLGLDWRRRRRRGMELSLVDPPPDDGLLPAVALERRELYEHVLAQLSRLPRRQRVALTLRFVDDRSIVEVAAIMDISPHVARALCSKALAGLRQRLGLAPVSQSGEQRHVSAY
jgi:RNA polymerase sigma-70 factor (ECF subfamily)